VTWHVGDWQYGDIAPPPGMQKKIGGYQCVRYASGRHSQDPKIDSIASLVVDAHYHRKNGADSHCRPLQQGQFRGNMANTYTKATEQYANA
jgi:hypothetical protein